MIREEFLIDQRHSSRPSSPESSRVPRMKFDMSLDAENRPETFVYEDKDHNSFLLEKLNTLRQNRQFCDVILQVKLNLFEIIHKRNS